MDGHTSYVFSNDKGSEQERRLILCFSHLRWDFVYQRPQHLFSRAVERYRVVFVEEPVFVTCSSSYMKTEERSGVTVCTPHVSDVSDPDDILAAQEKLLRSLILDLEPDRLVTWYYTPLALEFSRFLSADVVVYDNMDELSAFRGASPHLAALEDELLGKADVVFTGGSSLYEAKRCRHSNVLCLPSSVDTAHFEKARLPQKEPDDQAALAGPKIGFFGVVDERLDLDLLAAAARARPGWTFVMIGPVVKIDPETLPQTANIVWLGRKSYEELPVYIAGWDVAIMPFALNEATRFISPTKTPEYLAAGVPVVSTPIRDVVRPYGALGLVEIADGPTAFVLAIERALKPASDGWRDRVDAKLSTMSWDKTWGLMDAAIQQSLDSTPHKQTASVGKDIHV